MAQSYSNLGGNGDRRPYITVTTTATAGGGVVSGLVDSSQFTTNAFWWSGSQSGREVVFDFRSPRLITEAKWYQSNAGTHGTWQWQGSPDNAAWTNIGATFTLGGTAQTITTLSGNVTSYRYYRLLQTAGTTNSSPFLLEIEFLIDASFSLANTVWNSADQSNATLTNATLTATTTATGGWVRSAYSASAGKYYWETRWIVGTSSITAGIALASAALPGAVAGSASINWFNGDISINGSASGSSISQVPNDAVVGFAVDFTNKLFWTRVAPTGNWNGSATANPATATGGLSIASIATGPLFAFMGGAVSDIVSANFGDGTFTGAVPSGFTAGFRPLAPVAAGGPMVTMIG